MKHRIYLGLGSNLGDRQSNLTQAIQMLEPDIRPRIVSPIYETVPWGYQDQPLFLNCVLEAATTLTPRKVLKNLKSIEIEMGRQPSIRFGPRLIDLDILFYDNLVVSSKGLTIPHPRLTERAFVLLPLSDIAADLLHPITGMTIRSLAAAIDKTGVEIFVNHEKGCST
ncbi:MAG: 2-amino-4-hydroxy-6-hydroxymethyldihydropteridine diphosphokinase [Anaerolineaceae bacterium]|nr:2-amino-4-hydroxy-6-hydroxymethyldihydropteridine diphosphokinase [Anaerolineaceae bacterium]MBN2677426.1 2-amino-4-hydroxy-6-hydroxymethyldihydropteridine diphosphokinase [Anaerolineaceae bacterium]